MEWSSSLLFFLKLVRSMYHHPLTGILSCIAWNDLKKNNFFMLFWFYLFITLQYCIGFAIHQHASATGVHVFPILKPTPISLPIPSLWVIPVHQSQASCIMHWTWTGDSFLIWYYTCFNAILPNHPTLLSPTESKRLFYTSVSLLLSRIQGCCYQLSKFWLKPELKETRVSQCSLQHCL